MALPTAELKMVEDHIAQGERHVIQQEELISRLRSRGLPTDKAELLLIEFRASLRRHWEHRDVLMQKFD